MVHDTVPALDEPVVDNPPQLPLGQDSVGHVEAGVFVDVRLSEAQGVEDPEVLLVTVVVLGRTQGVGHAFQAVHDWAREIVRRINSGKKKDPSQKTRG